MKLQKGTSFIEFYYRGLCTNSSDDLRNYILANKWYFDRQKEEIKEQFRRIYQIRKRNEVRNGKKD
ncbi:hypothetical protein FUSO7_11300 [Fusobacterium necrophorum BFTR-2]|uniref:hypothetical protein n=1 Tax=Fusobacterium necrophorum TaxID=859 RepID=UPI0004616749|nr:hypothetical protein [Fusobacterium necrophorum]KDE69751.1 hypothetical protein FUSO7_11300 [Fusobacterium necrophorum BFTR-2]